MSKHHLNSVAVIALIFVISAGAIALAAERATTKARLTTEQQVDQLRSQVTTLQRRLASLEGEQHRAGATSETLSRRLGKLEDAVRITDAGVTLVSSGKLHLDAATMALSAGLVRLDAGQVETSGVLKSETLITNSVISNSYTPGAGNIW